MSARRLVTIMLLALAGCSGGDLPRVPVYGRVALRGCPIRSGKIAFTPDRERGSNGPSTSAQLAADGRFQIPDGGLPPGWYRITVASLDVPLPAKFRDPDLAGLVREVIAGRENSFEIELEE